MDRPQLIKLDPKNLDDEVRGPILSGLVEKGWTVGTSLILHDPRADEHDQMRVGLLMIPPHPDRGARDAENADRWLALIAISTLVTAASAVTLAFVLLSAG